jgi:nitroreductase
MILVDSNDNRALVAGGQTNFSNARWFCVMVSDILRFKRGEDSLKMTWAAMDAAYVSQNIDLFCAGVGLKTRPRVGMDIEKLRVALKLSSTQHPMINNPVSK